MCHLSIFHIQQNAYLWPTFVLPSDRSAQCWFLERKLAQIKKVNISGSTGPNKSFKMGKFSLPDASVNWKFVTVALDILGLLLSPSNYQRNSIKCVNNCEDHSLLDFTSTVQYLKYFIYNLNIHSSRANKNPQMTSSQCQWLHSSVG